MALGFIKKIFTFGKDTAAASDDRHVPDVADTTTEPLVDAVGALPPEEAAALVERDELLDEAEAINPDPERLSADVEVDIYPLPHDHHLAPAEERLAGEADVEGADKSVPVKPEELSEDLSDEESPEDMTSLREPPYDVTELHVQESEAKESLSQVDDGASDASLGESGSETVDDAPVESAAVTEIEEEQADAAEAVAQPETPVALPKGFSTATDRPVESAPAPVVKRSWFQRLRDGLSRTSSHLTGQIASLFTKRKLDDATLQDLEDLLIQADLGVETALRITDTLASERYGKDVTGGDVSRIMAGEITKVLEPVAKPLELDLSHKPHVILVVGVNGTGKTTTIGKLAAKLSGAGLKVMMAAGDTFRAAAIEQLKIWAERTGSDIVSSKLGADAAGLAYEAYEQAKLKKSDVLIIDTAGRLQNKSELMAELEKIVRVLGKLDPDAPHTVLQTLDATTGQNAMNQVEIFRNVAGVSGLIMTKLDGTARGGILVAIAAKHKLPVYFIGVGEGIDDLEPFEAKDFAQAIAGVEE
ncbi:signal recognition particle-docking protein FtsY [Sinorhizobium sp. BG8]|uniref:signal recognition particle-docking protein FtsY n=1 Tax=Sinorhizobium sp. BG8 TaxID=2613773 RepID=UPI00193EBEEC|nr:signal recognition particle-docking protein FtsY [Sinorhizobium sp. BG8]QRM53536.1 signal recognition particle-docking protein FtsY [Sinorhizobium sp. BG8]